ncbi:monooxygenase 2-like [Papaver somniferum]|uniref:monooxygenase 2-like n=1 Tax=Papaver somniferum TaxID=3469 RepID=UPI000E6F7035|nr:monooxygenase 2-like [Papaver somniferum]
MENIVMSEEVVIVGGGVAGLATALALKRVGVKSLVLERANELRVTGGSLTLFPNAWIALEAVGVAEKLTSVYKPFKRGDVTNIATGVTQEILFTSDEGDEWLARGPRSVHRRALLEALLEELPADTIRYSSKLCSLEKTERRNDADFGVIIHLEDGTTIHTKVLIGCDGVHSVVAKWLGLKEPVYSGRYAVRGLGVYPEGHGLKHEVKQFVAEGQRFGILPNNNTDIFWFMTYNSTPSKELEMAKGDPKIIQKTMLEKVPDSAQIVKDVIQHACMPSLSWGPLQFRYPWDLLFGKVSNGTITVAGDAMHPMTPDLGQGGCSALEDAVVLGRHIGNSYIRNGGTLSQEDLEVEIGMYVKERRFRTAGLITGSYISGWAQQGGGGVGRIASSRVVGWLAKFVRDTVFYKIGFRRLVGLVQYDCGKLPTGSTS